ncbi:MAG: LysM peptidoglycan-binding domain-containing protein [Gammaproteobacteria bacterium]|nr:LysM peptidoglycan-binding domain-containing protein [Gammaproteobacteria bacterium]
MGQARPSSIAFIILAVIATASGCGHFTPHDANGVALPTRVDGEIAAPPVHLTAAPLKEADLSSDEPAPAIVHDTAPDADEGNIALQFSGTPEQVVPSADANGEPVIIDAPLAAQRSKDDLWQRIRNGFKLNHDHKKVAGDIAWFQRNQAYLDRTVDRAEPYLYMVVEEAERRHIPLEIALLPIVESAFQPFAYSHGRASGIWQFIPGTGRLYGLKQNWWYDGRRDVYAATRAAFNYLQGLAEYFHGDWELALASYNSGEGTVQRAVARNQRARKRTDFWNLKLPLETRGYVPRLLAVATIIDQPERYGLTLRSLPNKPYLARVPVDGQIDLAFAAYLAEINIEDMYRYNPAFNRWATDPEGPHYLLLPVETAEVFSQRIAEFPMDKRVRWESRKLQEGETLASLARAYGTTVDVLERVNNVKASKLRAGRDIVIPLSMHTLDETAPVSIEPVITEKAADETPPEPEKTTYVVRRGDTLSSIARKQQVDVKDLAQWNNMRIRDPLILGRSLVIWSEPPEPEPEPVAIPMMVSAPLAGPPEDSVLRQINYVVRRGDTLVRVAERFKVTIEEILNWNRLPKNKRLRPGQKIMLHIDVRSQ